MASNLINFLDLKEWDENHSSVWRQIVSRFGQADYDDLTKKATRTATLKSEWDAKAYARNRAAEYPDYASQLDEIYHNGIDSWKAIIKVTKDKYPKG